MVGQFTGSLLVAVGLDKNRAMFDVELLLPVHRTEIVFAVYERRGASSLIERKIFYVDPCIWEIEVGLVLSSLRCRGAVLVGAFIFVGHTVEVEKVSNLAFLKTLDLLTLQRTYLVDSNIVPILHLEYETRARSCTSRNDPQTMSTLCSRIWKRSSPRQLQVKRRIPIRTEAFQCVSRMLKMDYAASFRPSKFRASTAVAGLRSYWSAMSTIFVTSSALLAARRSRSNLTLSSSPVLQCPPSSRHH